MLEIKTEKGLLKYRMPNILEAFDLLEVSGITEGEKNPLRMKRNIIKNLAPFLILDELENISTYEELLLDVETFTEPVSMIADEIVSKTFMAFKKKTS